jgi:ferritin-like metal-binding protein YciE
MLRVVAERAGDQETARVAERILAQEQEAASKLDALLEEVSAYDVDQQEAAA